MADYLKRIGGHFYLRLRIPSDLLPFFNGRREIKKSLRTAKYNTARGLVRLQLGRAEGLFAKIRSGLMTNAEIGKLVADYFARSEQADADAEDSNGRLSTTFIDYDSEDGEHSESSLVGLELHLSDMMENLARDQHETVAHLADHILEEAGIELEKDSREYRQLCREALRGAIDATSTQLDRIRGNYVPAPVAVEAPAEASKGEPLSRLIREYTHECSTGGRWRGRTKTEAQGCLSLLLRIVGRGEPPDRDIRTITRRDLISFRETLTRWPANATKAKKYRGKSVAEVLAIADAPFLSTTTINKYLVFTGALMRWAVASGYTETDYSKGLSISKRNVKPSEEKEAYDREDLLKLVRSPLSQFRETRPERFFIPWIGAYSGMRLAEIAQLHLSDIKEIEGAPCFDINTEGDRQLKTAASRRIVPVHSVLIELGLLEYAEELREKGEVRLWPNLKRTQTGYGQDIGRWFQRWNRKYITEHPKKSFHSLRHSFETALKRAHVSVVVIAELTGHSHGSIDLDRYGDRFEAKQLLDAVEKVKYGIEEELRKLPRLE